MAGHQRAGLTKSQAAMLQAVKDLTVDGVSPSYDELAARCGLTGRGQVSALLHILRRKGRVNWEPNRARSLQVLEDEFPQETADLSPLRLRGVIEEAAEALAANIGQSQAADVLAKVLEKHRTLARRERP